jgi:hypothetical protein
VNHGLVETDQWAWWRGSGMVKKKKKKKTLLDNFSCCIITLDLIHVRLSFPLLFWQSSKLRGVNGCFVAFGSRTLLKKKKGDVTLHYVVTPLRLNHGIQQRLWS